MGDRDFRSVIDNAIDAMRKETDIEIDASDIQTIYLEEVIQCLRRSYYDRVDPKELESAGRGFNDLFSGLLRKSQSATQRRDYSHKDINLRGQADMIVDDIIVLFRSTDKEIDNPYANDILYLNACMWIYDKADGVIVYLTPDKKDATFSTSRNKKMFEEVMRRVTVLHDLLKEKRVPILEPSEQCTNCQYYERCFIKKKNSKQLDIAEMLKFGGKD